MRLIPKGQGGLLARTGKVVQKGYKPIKALTETGKAASKFKFTNNPKFKSELDWSPQGWFGKRPVGAGGYTQEEVQELLSNVPEYLKIEKDSKNNGTWLKLPDNTYWEGDPREWVMMQSKKYKNFIRDSKLPGNYTHESNNWEGTQISPHPANSGKLFGEGFYLFKNPTGKDTTLGKIYTTKQNRDNTPIAYNVAVRSINPAIYDSFKDKYGDFFIADRSHPARTGTFHYPRWQEFNPNETFDPRLDNDVLILDGAWKGGDKIITGFPNGEYAFPEIKFITGNTGNFSRDPRFVKNIFRGIGTGSLIYNTVKEESSE